MLSTVATHAARKSLGISGLGWETTESNSAESIFRHDTTNSPKVCGKVAKIEREMGIIKLDRLNMTAQKVTLPMGLVVEEITLKTESAGYDSRKNALEMSKPGVVRARVTADDLANFLAGEFPAPLRDPKVELIPGFVLVSATAKVLIEITATAKCLLEVESIRTSRRLGGSGQGRPGSRFGRRTARPNQPRDKGAGLPDSGEPGLC